MSLEQALLLLAAGALSGFLNVMSAGSSMLTLPVLMFMGLDSTTANGTNRVGIVLQNITATWKYRSAGHRHLRLGLKLSVPAVLGAIVGAWTAAHMTLGSRGAVWIKRITLGIIAAIIVKLLMDM